jgi:hypothetical protein
MVRFLRPGDTGRDTAEKMVTELNSIDGIFDAHIAEPGDNIVIEWNMPDQDFRFPSGVTIDDSDSDILEATIRMGTLGDRKLMDEDKVHDLEGKWIDVALDAALSSNMLEDVPDSSVDSMIDLGDRYIESDARPHFRMHHRANGYSVGLREFVDFVEELAEGFDRRFGTLQDRASDPEFAEFFR